jgi:hypothetical protein
MSKRATWETELWSYLGMHDELSCQYFAKCHNRQTSSNCSCPVFGYTPNVYKKTSCKCSCPVATNQRNIPCHNTNVAFMETLKPGRVSELVERVSQNWLKRSRILNPPVPSELIYNFAPHQNISIRHLPLKACHGALWKIKDSSWIIYLNDNDCDMEKRVTLFHEAFHILAHFNSSVTYRKKIKQEGSFSEYLADAFALKLLLPENWIRRDWLTSASVAEIANTYQVPQVAVYSRLRELNLQ